MAECFRLDDRWSPEHANTGLSCERSVSRAEIGAERKSSERSGAVSGVIETDMSGERIFRRSCSAHMLCPHVVYCWQIALHIALIPSASWYTGVGLLEFRLLLSSVAHCYS